MGLLDPSHTFKPFKYPWAYEAWQIQQRIHWIPDEVPLAEDVRDWHQKLTEQERNLLSQIFRFFTQADVEVNNCYMQNYSRVFHPAEIQMMLAAFSNMETIHMVAYSHLLDTVGMPETEYQAFMSYKEMKDKYEYMQQWNSDTPDDLVRTLAVFGAFTEGLQLFASFAMLMNFPRYNKMKGMGQIVTWSVRDETLHTQSIIRLYKTLLKEQPQLNTKQLHDDLIEACETIVKHEDAFIDLAFELGDIEGMQANDIKNYIRFIADRRLTQLDLPEQYHIKEHPLPWLDRILGGLEHTNFFENRATEYTRAATKGSWEEAFA